MKYNRIYILGISGSGKTFLGRILSDKLKITHYDLDDIYFIHKYDKPRTKLGRIRKLKELLRKKRKWIIDGNGGLWNRNSMKKADLVIWLQTPLTIRSWRIIKRFLRRRGRHKETLKDCLSLVHLSSKYRFGKKPFHYSAHKSFLEENCLNYVEIKNKKELEKMINKLV